MWGWFKNVWNNYVKPAVNYVLSKPWIKWPLIIATSLIAAPIAGVAALAAGATMKIAAAVGTMGTVVVFLAENFAVNQYDHNRERERLEGQVRTAERIAEIVQEVTANQQADLNQLRIIAQQATANNNNIQNIQRIEREEGRREKTAHNDTKIKLVNSENLVGKYQERCDEYGVPHDDLREATTSIRPRTGGR
ncbi:MAG: hypothetical protein ACK4PR_11685 [Gammaproteobacteria bacterium]